MPTPSSPVPVLIGTARQLERVQPNDDYRLKRVDGNREIGLMAKATGVLGVAAACVMPFVGNPSDSLVPSAMLAYMGAGLWMIGQREQRAIGFLQSAIAAQMNIVLEKPFASGQKRLSLQLLRTWLGQVDHAKLDASLDAVLAADTTPTTPFGLVTAAIGKVRERRGS